MTISLIHDEQKTNKQNPPYEAKVRYHTLPKKS